MKPRRSGFGLGVSRVEVLRPYVIRPFSSASVLGPDVDMGREGRQFAKRPLLANRPVRAEDSPTSSVGVYRVPTTTEHILAFSTRKMKLNLCQKKRLAPYENSR